MTYTHCFGAMGEGQYCAVHTGGKLTGGMFCTIKQYDVAQEEEQKFIDSFGPDYKGLDENGDPRSLGTIIGALWEGWNEGIDAYAAALRKFYRDEILPMRKANREMRRALGYAKKIPAKILCELISPFDAMEIIIGAEKYGD